MAFLFQLEMSRSNNLIIAAIIMYVIFFISAILDLAGVEYANYGTFTGIPACVCVILSFYYHTQDYPEQYTDEGVRI